MLRKIIVGVVIILTIGFTQTLKSQDDQSRLSPKLLNYQGYLTDTFNNPINDSLDILFRIYDASSGGNMLWSESQVEVPVLKGIFHVILGSITSLPDSIFTKSTSRWLELRISSQNLAPRTRIVSTPYAVTSIYADTAEYVRASSPDNDWIRSGGKVYTYNLTDSVGIGTASPRYALDVNGIICGGTYDTVRGLWSAIGGGFRNRTGTEPFSVIAGGGYNGTYNAYTTVGGGNSNYAQGVSSTVGGGETDTAYGDYSFIGGGLGNKAKNFSSTVAGGWNNIADGQGTTVAGGILNLGYANRSFIGGGTNNTVTGDRSFIGAGYGNAAGGNMSMVAGGNTNSAAGSYSTVAGGSNNSAAANYSAILGGYANTIQGGAHYSYLFGINSLLASDSTFMVDLPHIRFGKETGGYEFPTADGGLGQALITNGSGRIAWNSINDNDWGLLVGGGSDTTLRTMGNWGLARYGNRLYGNASNSHVNFGVTCTTGVSGSDDVYCTVGGGSYNVAGLTAATVGGGSENKARGGMSVIAGGVRNQAVRDYGVVSGGYQNLALGSYTTIAGGGYNYVDSLSELSSIGGGSWNTVTGSWSVLGGGYFNTASGNYSVITGGIYDTVSAVYGAVLSGCDNLSGDAANDTGAVVAGGIKNAVTGKYVFLGGGTKNYAAGVYSAILGGYADTITSGGAYSYLFGIQSKLTQDSTFMVDLPHIRFGKELNGYEFPTADGGSGEALVTNGSGKVGWASTNDNDWGLQVGGGSDTTLWTMGNWGLVRYGNVLFGNAVNTHVNLGVACTTSTSGIDFRYITISGGYLNKASGNGSTICGGKENQTISEYNVICGGQGNRTDNLYASISGGEWNINQGFCATIAGGGMNKIMPSAGYGFIGGGAFNTVDGGYSTIIGGNHNTATNWDITIGGGEGNTSSGDLSVIGGGVYNSSSGYCTVIGGGGRDTVIAPYGAVFSGYDNLSGDAAIDTGAVVVGGILNRAIAKYDFLGGGFSNLASGDYSTIGGGNQNKTESDLATVAGGRWNTANGWASGIGGGDQNAAPGYIAYVGGGISDTASGAYTFIGAGYGNKATADVATVAGGIFNRATAWGATVGGGSGNIASGGISTIGGGSTNAATADYATVAGGFADSALAASSFAVGNHSVVGVVHTNSVAFNGQVTSAAGQTRVNILAKSSGTFTIDHPLDPENKILNHYFVESPGMSNIYEGDAVIGANGRVEVILPDYFKALNKNSRVQLTGVGTYEVYLAEDISGNRFVIGGKPGTKVYWMATGERKDPSAEATRLLMPVEQPKTGDLAGRSLDDNFLIATMAQLEKMGYGDRFQFRHEADRKRYEESKKIVNGK